MGKTTQRRAKPGLWDESDLIHRLCHALDIAKLTVEHLAKGYVDARDPAKNVRAEKIVSETGVLLLAASSALTHAEVAERVRDIALRLIPHARDQRALLGMCLEPFVAWDYALPHVCLSRLGCPDAQFDGVLRCALASQASAARERVPHRVMEQEWAAQGLSGHASERKMRQAARASALGRPLDLLACTRDDLYAYTHALMYITDFGGHPSMLPRQRRAILTEAEAALAWCLDEQDYDLGGEILLSWPLTGKSWSAAAAFAFRVLARVEDKAGFLPTASTRVSEIAAREGGERTQYLLATAYHTAYVMGLLCAASLRPGYAPPDAIPATQANHGAAKLMLQLLDADSKEAHWRDEFGCLADMEADALAGFLLAIALRRRAARRDYSGMLEMLRLACDLDLAASPCAVQATELLGRLAAFSDAAAKRQVPQEVDGVANVAPSAPQRQDSSTSPAAIL